MAQTPRETADPDARIPTGRSAEEVADRLVRLYATRFGGRPQGKFRISRKLLRSLTQRHKLAEHYLTALGEALFERGFVFVDLESYFVVLDQHLFENYRRVNEKALAPFCGDGL